ncbi:MAG: hemolysin family protein [Ruminococcus sp.]|jgi:putative hemolysin|nr:hemolysin family protein [Ruminococcus sp.]
MDGDGARSVSLLPVVIIIFIIFFLYSLAESSLTEIPSQRIRNFESSGGLKKRLFKITKKSSKFLAVFFQIRLLQNIAIFLIIFQNFNRIMVKHLGDATLQEALLVFITTALATLLIQTVFFYSIPRRIVRGLPPEENERLAIFLTPAVDFAMLIFTPLVLLSSLFVKLIALIFRIEKPETDSEVTEEEILLMVDAGSDTGAIEESQAEMISNIFEFSDTPISDIMTHRTDIVAVKNTATPAEIAEKSAESGFSRLPVYNGTVDKIIGIIIVKDLLPLISCGAKEREAAEFLRPVLYFPETAAAKNVFKKLRDNKMQMAVITDEYGGTAGIVTMEDLLEEIVGSIQDEYDDETENIAKIDEWSYNIDGLADPIDVFSELGLARDDNTPDFDTMSAFLIALAGVLPSESDKIEGIYDGWKFTAESVNDMRITSIRAEKCPENFDVPEFTEGDTAPDEKSE